MSAGDALRKLPYSRASGHLGFVSADYFLPLDPARFTLQGEEAGA